MPRCPSCGTPSPAMARFCSICGSALAPPAAPPPARTVAIPTPAPAGAPDAGTKRGLPRAALAGGAGLALIALAGFLFARASGLLGAPAPASSATGVLAAPAVQTAPAPILSAPETQAPQEPVLAPPGTVDNAMPEDVIAYLRWLKQFEAERRRLEAECASQLTLALQDLIKDYTTGASLGLLDADSTGETPREHSAPSHGATIADVIQKWNQATGIFQQKIPPNPCASLATTYGQALAAGVQQMGAIQGILATAQASIKEAGGRSTGDAQSALTDLFQQKSTRSMSRNVDSLIRDANGALDALRDRYTQMPSDIDRAHFSITAESGGLALPPLLGL